MDAGLLTFDLPLLAVATAAAVTDVREGKVYNRLTYPAVLLAFGLHALVRPPGLGLGGAAEGFLVGFVPMFVAYAAGGLGGGDVKLMTAVGTFLGPLLAVYALLYTFLSGAVLCLMLIVYQEGPAGLGRRLRHLGAGEDGTGRLALRFPFAAAVWLGVVWVLVERYVGASLADVLLRSVS